MKGRVIAFLALAVLIVISAACTDDPSAQFFQSGRQVQNHQSLDATASGQANQAMIDARFLHGVVDRPDPKLTPGVVATTDVVAVCHEGKRIKGMFLSRNYEISPADAQAVYAAYKIPADRISHYGLDFLIPLQLGGANVRANIWPIATTHGVGFKEKEILNIRLHVLVCQRQMPLDQAQKGVATDWVKLWLIFG